MTPGNMSKIAINNEIVLMRQAVRQSRVAIVRKLIKEAKLLQARKHGDEKVQEKCKRKAGRLVAEIAAIKKLKDDEISKFGLTNTRNTQEVLNDTNAQPATRVMARTVRHKTLADRITKFKEKFPEYEQYLGPGRKKLSKIQRQANREVRNALVKSASPGEANRAISDASEEVENRIVDENVNEKLEESSNEEDENNDDLDCENEPLADSKIEEDTPDPPDDSIAAKHGLEPGSILRIHTPNSMTTKKEIREDPSGKPKAKLKKTKEEKKIDTNALVVLKKPKPIKVISKEATVRRFTDLMEGIRPEECIEAAESSTNSKKRDIKIEKQVDSFFMTENGESEYLSVVVPKAKLCEDAEEDDRFSQNHAAKRQKSFHERNNKFFSKIDQRVNGGYGDKFGANTGGRQRRSDFGNGTGPSEKFGRQITGPTRPASETKDEELHPSWAARKKQQEILKKGFQGKRIVFDD